MLWHFALQIQADASLLSIASQAASL